MDIIKFILKRWYVVLVIALLLSGGLYIEKSKVLPTVPQSGFMSYTAIAKLESSSNSNSLVSNAQGNITEVTIIPIIRTWGNEQKFIDATSEQYDYLKLNKNWPNIKDNKDRFKWLNEHFIINYLGNNIYEFTLAFKAEDLKDSQYIEENGPKLLVDYIDYAGTNSSLIYPGAKFSIIETHQFIDQKEVVTPGTLAKKYAIIGFIVGALVGIAILCVLFLRKNKLNHNDLEG